MPKYVLILSDYIILLALPNTYTKQSTQNRLVGNTGLVFFFLLIINNVTNNLQCYKKSYTKVGSFSNNNSYFYIEKFKSRPYNFLKILNMYSRSGPRTKLDCSLFKNTIFDGGRGKIK